MENCNSPGVYGDICRTQCGCIKLKELEGGENIHPRFFMDTCPDNIYQEALRIMQERFPGSDFETLEFNSLPKF